MNHDPQPRLGRPKLGAGPHLGFQNLRSQPGVYRCRLRPELSKRDPCHADYKGVLLLTGFQGLNPFVGPPRRVIRPASRKNHAETCRCEIEKLTGL
jgi:hypothetical protein